MPSARNVLFFGSTVVMLLLMACSAQEEKKSIEPASPHGQGIKKETVVAVPPSVQGKWKSVRIGVINKQSGRETLHEIPIGSEVAIPETNLAIKVETFLPHFIMQGTTLTSQSNELKNPAAHIRVYEGGKEVFKGWIFALYPSAHAFVHPQYGFTLKDVSPAR